MIESGTALRRWGWLVLITMLMMSLALPLVACGTVTRTIEGQVTKVDANAKTFTVKGDDGRTYDFKMVSSSKGDLAELKEHLDLKKPVTVKYREGTAPYEVIEAD